MEHKNEITYQLTINPAPLSSKPPKDDKIIGKIVNNLNVTTGLTINHFSKIVRQPFGYTWSGGLFHGNINNENWYLQQIFGLDFDKGEITIEEVFQRLNEFGITPQVWYTSFSDSPSLRKFRVVLFTDMPANNQLQHSYIAKGLLTLFPEADQKCKNRGRWYFGGKESFIIHTDPIPLQKLVDALGITMTSEDGGRTRKITPELFKNSSNHKNGKNWSFLYDYNTNTQISPKNKKYKYEGGQLEKIDWCVARKKVKILDDFLKGKWLNHDLLWGLATNLIYINGGRKLFKETMQKYNELGLTQYTQNNFNIHSYLNVPKYPPLPLYEFSPYKEDHEHYDIISATKDIRGEVIITQPINMIKLSDAEALLKEKFEFLMKHAEKGKIYIFILPTAIGKTRSLLFLEGVIISVPTNDLKNEISDTMKVKHITSPDPVEFEDESLNRTLRHYYSIGLPKKATAILYKVIEQGIGRYSQKDIDSAQNYIDQLSACKYSTETILTTHSRALHTEYSHDTIVYDEDPLNQILDIKQIQISDLHKLKIQSGEIFKSDLDPVIEKLEKSIPTEINNTPTLIDIEIDELVKQVSTFQFESNIFEFFHSSFFVKDKLDHNIIHYVVKKELPKDKKVIVMSATAPSFIYKKLYGDKVEIIDLTDVEQQGKIIQYTNKSCSRNGLNRYVDSISKQVGDKPVITFMSYGHHFKNPVKEMYFGNCSGYNGMSGKDLAVVGTPHRNNVEYLLTAKVLGVDYKTTDTTMSYQNIEYNGFKFKFNCFDHEELRNIQLALIQSDLIQAVGRARTLRTDAQVDLYSNFPLRISDEFRY
ncbi:hypothetical protein D1164_04490 [Mariniphaga sediminis]|uniref:Uncharacterized protein n=1 Tax=Mariniphaga sediminis TaxID=1628158 RepID=A0A399D2R8_9BACT|nr:hypothetical protein [Mariniphaga sediminis]RIH66174.1 hypothetical protein D1164_04490 [Mariniphaga sediminis]